MFYLIDKKKGITSFKAIKEFARKKNIKKIGHTGTLDPLATGLLLVATGADTKLIDYIDKGFKKYRATLEFGKKSDTYDIEGDVIDTTNFKMPTKNEVLTAFKTFEGTTKQMPPIFSAKKINGQKAYDLARKGKKVKLKEVSVTMKDIKIISISERMIFDITVSRGTYIRSLINDLGEKLMCGAIMTDLRRTNIGDLSIDDINHEINIENLLIIPILELNNITDLKNGKVIDYKESDGEYALKFQNKIIGVVVIINNKMKVKKLLGNKI